MDIMKKTLKETAEALVSKHVEVDPEITHVFLARNENEIRIVEITSSVGTTKEIIPFSFKSRPRLGIHFPTVIILLSPEELELLKKKELELPKGWGAFKNLIPIDIPRTGTKNG